MTVEELKSNARIIVDDYLHEFTEDRMETNEIVECIIAFAEVYHREKMKEITDEEIMTYFNNHSNCYSNDSHINIPAMTRGAVLEFANWMRDRMIGGVK